MVLWQGEGEAYGLLARLLAAEYGLPGLPELARREGGKPFFPGRPDLHFNVSHSGGLALCGVGSASLGVDILWGVYNSVAHGQAIEGNNPFVQLAVASFTYAICLAFYRRKYGG